MYTRVRQCASSDLCQFRLRNTAGIPIHGQSETKAFPSFTASSAQRTTPEGPIVWQIIRAQDVAAVVFSPAETLAVLAVKGEEGKKECQRIQCDDREPTWDIGQLFEDLCGRMLDYSELESLQLQ